MTKGVEFDNILDTDPERFLRDRQFMVGNHVIFYTYIRIERIRIFVYVPLSHLENIVMRTETTTMNIRYLVKRRYLSAFCSKLSSKCCFPIPHNHEQRQRAKTESVYKTTLRNMKNTSIFVCCLQRKGI